MTDQPYTPADLIAEAARQHATLSEDAEFMCVGEMMQDSEVASLAPQHTAEDIDGQPNDADGVTWQQLLPLEADACEAYDLAQNRIYDLIRGAADVSAWAVQLGADGLQPEDHTLTVEGDGRPLVRVHVAFAPELNDDARAAFILGLGRDLTEAF
ncbi:PAS domain-containing protein [Streptomyces sp. NPDC088746]|uniref:PAS domain-containing protein n=1 Tax=Streptomyces sp. NPDC088746 TaxID=3365885 RepID=UPI003821DE2D